MGDLSLRAPISAPVHAISQRSATAAPPRRFPARSAATALVVAALVCPTAETASSRLEIRHSASAQSILLTAPEERDRQVAIGRATLDSAVGEAARRVGPEIHGSVSSARLEELAQELDELLEQAKHPLPFEGPNRPLYSAGIDDPAAAKHAGERLARAIAAATVAWERELAAERERIRRAEEEARRKAAEEARRKAAEAAAREAVSPTPPAGSKRPSADAAPAQARSESPARRVRRIMAGSPAGGLGLQIGACANPNAYACYYASASWIRVTPLGLGLSDCQLLRIVMHEYRHHMQWSAGQWVVADGTLTNRAWLESDAESFAASYGCAY